MALSQVKCLDENHVNWRMNESKPEFFYSEDQRFALESLIHDGKDAFETYIKTHKVREFLSEPELERLRRNAEVYQPGSDHLRGEAPEEGQDATESLEYWPERSDISVPHLDMGWPDCTSYRGVTRVNVYTQPPLEGQTHIKEVVRKTIAQAQKVIAVVMDLFTDVDIFKDLLDASFKRKVAVYIILESSGLPYFLNMCERARMHKGHLKNLRVQSIGGMEFYTHSSKKVCGTLSQKFIFVDGDRAVSGSYSFTWMASRLDRNLITVLTGQAVDTFDKLFRDLYLTSRSVNLSKINLEEEPQPEPIPQSVPAPLPSAAVARKLINPKYALVTSSAAETGSGTSSDKNSAKIEGSSNPVMKPVQQQKEIVEPSPIHPGLVGLERVNMISYLPTWPEPDPPSDVIGFINVRDSSKPMQVHLMRSELFETSQAIRFKQPIAGPVESPPEEASLRQKPKDLLVEFTDAQQQPPLQSQLQSAQDKPERSRQAADQTQPAENLADAPGIPIPKRRTTQLVINHASSNDAPEISIIKKTDVESGMPLDQQGSTPNQVTTLYKTINPPQDVSTSVTLPQERHLKGAEDVNKEDQKDTPEMVREGDDTNEADNILLSYTDLTTLGKCFDASYADTIDSRLQLLVNGMHTGSGRMEDHRHPEGLNVMARFSQSMVDLRSEDQPQQQREEADNQRALADIPVTMKSNQMALYKYSERQPHVSSFGRQADIIGTDRHGHGRVNTKVVVAKPGCYHRPTKAAGHVIGGYKYWQGKLIGQEKGASGSRLSRGQPGNSRNGRPLGRHEQDTGLMGIYTSGQALLRPGTSRGPVPSQLENRMSRDVSLAKLSQLKQLRGRISGSDLGSLQRNTQLGHKGTV